MRTLTGVSRLFLLAAIAVAAVLVVGGAYFIGYVGQLQRELSDPQSAPERISAQLSVVERALGHGEFLKSYRDYWTGGAQAQPKLLNAAAQASRAAGVLGQLTAADGRATGAVHEIQAIVATFMQTAVAAPATPPSGLRGVSDDSVRALPAPAQLETTYLILTTSLGRLRDAQRVSGSAALGSALDRTETILVIALSALILCLLAVAWVMRTSVIHPLNSLERSLSAAAQGAAGQRIWGTDRPDEIGELARAGEGIRRRLADAPASKVRPEKGAGDLTLEGPALVLFEKLTAQVATAVDTLRMAGEAAKHSQSAFANAHDRIVQSNDEMRAAIMAELQAIAETISGAADQVQGEVSRLIEHIDEEHLLPSRGAPMALLEGPMSGKSKTLADVPKAEVLERLGDLAAAMRGVASPTQPNASDTAARIAEHAHDLFSELESVDGFAADDEGFSLEQATTDVEALGRVVAKLEARAEALSEQAVARLFNEVSTRGSPAELSEKAFAADLRTDGAIQTVFEAIERLNNVAAALARAGDALRQQRAIG